MKKIKIFLSALALCCLTLTSCDLEQELAPVAYPDGINPEESGNGAWNDPYATWQVLSGVDNGNNYVWVTGYIVGYINTFDGTYSKLREKSAVFGTAGAPNSNLMLADSPDETDWEKCIPVQLAYNTPGRDLSLANHPEYLHRQVTLRGTSGVRYLSVYGLRNCDMYNWGDEGIYVAPPLTFIKTAELNDGDQCLLVAGGQYAAQVLAQNYTYGYLNVDNVKAGSTVEGLVSNAYTFTKSGEYWIITDSYGRYVYQNDSAQNFQVGYDMPTSNYLWDVKFNDNGEAVITNVSRKTWIQYDANYGSYGCYNSQRGQLPAIYVLDSEYDGD